MNIMVLERLRDQGMVLASEAVALTGGMSETVATEGDVRQFR